MTTYIYTTLDDPDATLDRSINDINNLDLSDRHPSAP